MSKDASHKGKDTIGLGYRRHQQRRLRVVTLTSCCLMTSKDNSVLFLKVGNRMAKLSVREAREVSTVQQAIPTTCLVRVAVGTGGILCLMSGWRLPTACLHAAPYEP